CAPRGTQPHENLLVKSTFCAERLRAHRNTGTFMSQEIFKALGLSDVNSGAYLGNGEWSKTTDAGVIEPKNPSTGEVLAKVHASSAEDYETIVKRAQESFDVWRNTPAPV